MQLDDWRREGRTWSYRENTVFYRRSGSGPTLLLIHGFPTASWDWHRVWDALTSRFDVIAADMIGFGFSDKPPTYAYSIADQATLHEGLLGELGVSSVHVLAHDYGDSVAQELLARREEQGTPRLAIRSLCLLNGGIIPGTHRPLPVQKLLTTRIGKWVARLLSIGTLRRSFDRIFGPKTKPTERELREFWALIEFNEGRRVLHRLIRYMTEREVHRQRWVGALRTTRVPVRLINGSSDPISGAHVADAYRRLVAQADIVALPGIGHYPQVEAPAAVAAAAIAHIRAHEEFETVDERTT